MDFFADLLKTDVTQLQPHDWSPFALWTNISGDAATAFAYFVIPFALYYFVKRRKLSKLNSVFILFAALTLLCSLNHVLNIVSVWYPVYRLQGFVKVLTGSASLAVAFVLIYNMPTLIKIPTIRQLEDANAELKHKSEELKTQNEFLRNLAYSTYHDLREPIRGMAINSQILMQKHQGHLNEEMKGIVSHISTESKRMFGSVESIMKLTFLESEKYKFEQVCLNKVIANTEESLQQLIADSQAKIICEKLPQIEGNESLLGILFENIIANSIRFRSSYAPVIHIKVIEDEKHYTVLVADNGAGFNNQYRDQIFEMFKTLGNTSFYRGAGLGLAMGKRIVKMHGGSISATSTEGRGTIISIVLPKQYKHIKRQTEHYAAA